MKTVAKPNSQRGRIKGIYQRGNIFWFTNMEHGKRVQVSLGTDDFGIAVQKALEISAMRFFGVIGAVWLADRRSVFVLSKVGI